MKQKFDCADFGYCPRVQCHDQAVLPLGLTEEANTGSGVKVFCPRCWEVGT